MDELLILAVALPILGATLTTALPRRALAVGLLAALVTSATGLAVTAAVWWQGPLHLAVGGWEAPLGVALRADGLTAALLAMINLVALGISIYASGYFRASGKLVHFWPLWLLLWASLNGAFMSADLFNIYVTLEVMGLSAASLGALGGSRAAVVANLRYLLVGLLGSMTYLLGVALVYTAYGTLELHLLAERITAGPQGAAALVLVTAGLALKAALFPLHFWLPPAHSAAPAPVSAALSALVVKAAFYLILRLWLGPFAAVTTTSAAVVLGLLGAGGVVWGSWRALRAERLKLLAAYSTVAQVGYLFLFLPMLAVTPAGPGRASLTAGLALMALSHGFAKAGLFLAAGQLQQYAGHDRINDLGPAAREHPASTFAVALAGVALVGLPPSGTFFGKWLLISNAFATGQWWWVVVVLLGTLLAASYTFRVLSRAFSTERVPRQAPTDLRTELPALVLTATAVVLLLFLARPLWTLLGLDADAALPGLAGGWR